MEIPDSFDFPSKPFHDQEDTTKLSTIVFRGAIVDRGLRRKK